ncbi:MAG: hypothetical protein JWQ53_2467, partial [Klenkia sp.]|nr:hypothetical protein [Klenkia sp.]
RGLTSVGGALTSEPVAAAHGLAWVPAEEALAAR